MKRFLLLAAALLVSSASIFAQDGEIVWGGPGDPNSEFEGGLNDWTTVGVTDDDAVWVWEADGRADLGAYSGGTGAIQSPSVSNGAMVFDSDFYDNGGVQGDFGLGIAPAPATGELISPIIDLSGVGAVSLKFNQYIRQFASTTSVAYSMDGGDTWSDPLSFNDEIPTNQSSAANDVKEIALLGAMGTDQFRVKFIMEGNYYFWIVDDVQILRRERNDLQVNENFYAIAPNYATPASQVEPFGFLVDITNIGGFVQTNVNVNMTITDDSGTEIHMDDNPYGTVGDSLVENSSFGEFTPPAEVGTYTGTYTISSDSVDVDLSNNQLAFNFTVSDTVFAKESAPTRDIFPAAANWSEGDPHSWAYGNHYHVVNGEGYYANTVTFAIDADFALAGQELDIRLYEWIDSDENRSAAPDERLLTAFAIYEIQGTERWDSGNALITVPLLNLQQVTPSLKDDTDYILALEFRSPDAETDLRFAASDAYNYDAMVLNSDQQGRLRVAGMLGISGDIDTEEYSWVGFGRDLVPVVRMNVTAAPLISSNSELILPENTLVVNPNPAKDVMNAELSFAENVSEVYMRLLDIQGRMILDRQLENVQTQNETFDISRLAAGTYFLQMITSEGQLTKKVVVE